MKRKRDDGDDGVTMKTPKRLCKSAVADPGPTESASTRTSHRISESSTETPPNAITIPSESVVPAEPAPPNTSPDPNPTNSSSKRKKKQGAAAAATRNKPIRIPMKPRPKIIKLTPNRPYPSVPTSSNATGPRSKRKEGNNKICVTRRTELGAYLTRCKDVFVKQGYKELYLSAMGAAIPHAVMLATSLPAILPYERREIKTTVKTGSVVVTDEIIPQDEDDEAGFQTRMKASIEIIVRIQPPEGMEIDTTAAAVEEYESSD